MRKKRTIAAAAGATVLTAGLAAAAAALPAATAGAAPAPNAAHAVAPQIDIAPGIHKLVASKALNQTWTDAECQAELSIDCYTPLQINDAYNEAPLFSRGITGKGETIVIVDSYGSPTIENDLSVFDQTFGYPAPPSFKTLTPDGPVPAFNPDNGTQVDWADEATLDVEYAHAIAPGANIDLVETPVAETEGVTGFPQIVEAENYVIDHHIGDVITQSFGATEETFSSYSQLAPLRSAYINAAAHNVTVLASTGDSGVAGSNLAGTGYLTSGADVAWPASDPLVTAVGGTELEQSASGAFSSVVWNDTYNTNVQEAWYGSDGPNPLATTGGVSEFFRRPSYQDDVAKVTGGARGVPDISMSGACDGAVQIYTSFAGQSAGWGLICGTSEASPEFSGIVALADQVAGHPLGQINPTLYKLYAEHAPGLVDVTSGNNTVSFDQGTPSELYTIKGYNAGPGYDLASGVGTVNAAYLAYELAGR